MNKCICICVCMYLCICTYVLYTYIRKYTHTYLSTNLHTYMQTYGINVLFNDALNTFYLRLYGVGHMVKDHSDSERGNPLPPHGLLFPINSKGSFICTVPQQDSTYHGLCYTSRGALAGTRNSSMCPPHEGSIRRPIAP